MRFDIKNIRYTIMCTAVTVKVVTYDDVFFICSFAHKCSGIDYDDDDGKKFISLFRSEED